MKSVPTVLALLALCCGCASSRLDMDPTLLIQSPTGAELGVSTDYGIVFLGNRTRAGEIEVTAWFGDGPSIESTVVEPVGGGLYTAETDIRLPWVDLAFRSPEPGEHVTIVGRYGGEKWRRKVRVAQDPRVPSGLILTVPRDLREAPSQVGAGVFAEDGRLVGLVSGRVRLTSNGVSTDYLTAFGPTQLWRLVVHHREDPNKRRWVYRDDVL